MNQLANAAKLQVGDRVVYYKGGEPQHSGIVTKVNSSGQASQISSKWGSGRIHDHHPADAPTSYGTRRRYFRIKKGK